MSDIINVQNPPVVYGAMWCGDCRRSKKFLDERNIEYSWIDVEAQPEERETMKQYNGGRQSIPTIIFSNGTVLVEPSNAELAKALGISATTPVNR